MLPTHYLTSISHNWHPVFDTHTHTTDYQPQLTISWTVWLQAINAADRKTGFLTWHPSCHLRMNVSSRGLISNATVLLSSFSRTPKLASRNRSFKEWALWRHRWVSFWNPRYPLRLRVYHKKIGAWPLRLLMIVASREAKCSTFRESALIYTIQSSHSHTTRHWATHKFVAWHTYIYQLVFWKATFGACTNPDEPCVRSLHSS